MDISVHAPSSAGPQWHFAPVTVTLDDGTTLRLACNDSAAHLKNALDELQQGSFRTLYNSTNWLLNWIEHAARESGEAPCIIVARDETDRVAFVWPMALRRTLGINVLGWLGQGTFAVNTGCCRDDVGAILTRTCLLRIFASLREGGVPFEALHFMNQPGEWNRSPNPMLALARQLAPNGNHERALKSDYDALYNDIFSARERRNHARQRRRLAEYGDIDVSVASSANEQQDILETFFDLKAVQLQAIGVPDPFRCEGVKSFYRNTLLESGTEGLSPQFCGLRLNGTLVATLIGVIEGPRFTTLMSAITLDEPSKASPGQQLLEFLVRELCQAGIETFDFGPGPSPQKRRWEMMPRPLFHTFVALTPRARPATWMVAARARILQKIKNNQRAFRLLTWARTKTAGK